ncbi:hypothetical protein [Aestuariivirga sp.]|jgi:hypothetical protein|uniref:hypothetical protein n=1 Tax=Aestuariivirga sp. TaxID=2650926 RepID=UPI003784E2D3
MAKTTTISKKLRKIAASLQELATAIESFPAGNGRSAATRTRRSKKETIALKKLLKAERKKGVSVAKLAELHGVSKAYIYMVK